MIRTNSSIPGRAATVVTALALAAFTFVSASTAHAACGDVTGDGQVKATDALYVLKKAVSIYTTDDLTCESSWTCCGDVTGDSQVKATDALYVLKLAVSIYTAADLNCTCSSGTTATTTTTTTTTIGSSSLGLACTSAEVFVQLEGSDLDAGYTGLGHDGELIEGASITVRVKQKCTGTETVCTLDSQCTAPATCDPVCHCDDPNNAECEGVGPTHQGSCSASMNDCDIDSDCTGTETCEKFYGAPLPLSSAGVPVCITTYFDGDITGTANAQTGEGRFAISLRSKVHLGLDSAQPCPRCGAPASCSNSAYLSQTTCETAGGTWTAGPSVGDTDTCFGGNDAGTACTVHATSAMFGGISRDCPPAANTNVSGSGLVISMSEVSTSTVSKQASLPCSAPWNMHPSLGNGYCIDNFASCTAHSDCSRCISSSGTLELSGDAPVACTTNADCDTGNTCSTYPDTQVTCGWQCHCGFCDDGDGPDTNYPCFQTSECSAMSSTATCVQGSGSANPQAAANACTAGFCGKTETETCHDKTQGECAIQKWVECTTDADCASDDTCNVVQKPCFEPVISRTGSPSALGKHCTTDPAVGTCTSDADCGTGTCVDDSSEPVTAGLFCIPPTVSDSVNSAGGITGPGAIQFSTIIIACRCGDGQIGCDETCDDSNTTSGDGCSENCDIE